MSKKTKELKELEEELARLKEEILPILHRARNFVCDRSSSGEDWSQLYEILNPEEKKSRG